MIRIAANVRGGTIYPMILEPLFDRAQLRGAVEVVAVDPGRQISIILRSARRDQVVRADVRDQRGGVEGMRRGGDDDAIARRAVRSDLVERIAADMPGYEACREVAREAVRLLPRSPTQR